MILPRFELHEPETLDDAAALLGRFRHECDILAGGSDLLPNYKQRLNPKPHVVSLERVAELASITPTRIGAMARLADLTRHAEIQARLPVVAATAAQVASPLIIEQATLGGNVMLDTRCFYFNQSLFWRDSKGYCLKAEGDVCLVVPQKEVCYATNSSDMAPVLMALDAQLVFASSDGHRTVPIRDFYRHDGIARFDRHPHEILAFVEIAERSQKLRSTYRKLRIRDAIDFPAMGAAVSLAIDPATATLSELHIAIGAVDTTPRMFEQLTPEYIGRPLDATTIAEVADAIMDRIKPYNNVPLTPTYRKQMVGVYLRRILEELAEEPATAGA